MALKQQMVARLTSINAVSAAQLARETGITQQSLSRWLCQARNGPLGALDEVIISARTGLQKARIIVQAGNLTGNDLTAYLKREAVELRSFRRWRLALEEAGEESVGMAKRIAKLERELARKDRALAELATLLMRRETIEKQMPEEQDVLDRQNNEEKVLNRSMPTGSAFMDNSMAPSAIAGYVRRRTELSSGNS
jgi:transposase